VISLTYIQVPADVVAVHVLRWQDGRTPVEAQPPRPVSRDSHTAQIDCASGADVVVSFERNDGAYLLDGPLTCPASDGVRHPDPTWRRTFRIRAPPGISVRPEVSWVPATRSAGDGWPRCVWAGATAYCWGSGVDAHGAFAFVDGDRVWWTLMTGATAVAEFQQSAWARLIVCGEGADHDKLVATIAHPGISAERRPSLRLATAPVPNAHAVSIADAAVWVHGEQIPTAAWIELRAARSGPTYVSLDDVAQAPPSLPLSVALDEPRTLNGVARGAVAPAAGSIVTLFRVIDPPPVRRDPDHQPRRVFAGETVAGATGEFQFDALGDVEYELVAWHPQFGRGIAPVGRGETSATVRLESAGQVRGRVTAGGKPVAGVDVISLPDLTAYAQAADPTELKGGDGRTGTDGRFVVSQAPGGGGEVRVGGGNLPIRRFPLPRAPLPVVDLGDIDLGSPIEVTVTLDWDPGCDMRAVGPVGRTGLQVIGGTRAGPGLFTMVFPEEGTWNVHLVCGRDEHPLIPSLVSITQENRGKEVRMLVR
jgi:hypothetical protein